MIENTFQYTLSTSASMEGIGLHTGKPVKLEFCPAAENSGIYFIRTDLPGSPKIPALIDNVVSTNRGTTIAQNGNEVHTVEHVLASLAGTGITNCQIRMSNEEPPAADGSALEYVKLIKKAGLTRQSSKADFCSINKSFTLKDGKKSMTYLPSDKFEVTFTLDYANNILPSQTYHIEINPDTFSTRICKARTFGFEYEFEMLAANNLARGGSLENAIIIDNNGKIRNPEGLREEQELILHKILDLIGDLSLLSRKIRGHFIAQRTGHSFNIRFARSLREQFLNSMARKDQNKMYIEEIKSILPHRYPFLLVDRITSIVPGETITGYKNLTANEDFFNGHFPEKPVMPGVLMIEAMAQVAGVLFLAQPEHKGKTPFFCGIDKVRFRKPVVPGDRLDFTIKVLKVRGSTGKVRAEARVDDNLITSGELMFQLV